MIIRKCFELTSNYYTFLINICFCRDYDLKTLLYETSRNNDLYMTAAVVHASSDIKDLNDLQGKRACFPSYNGIAYNTILHELRTHNLLENSICPYEESLGHYFGSTCIPGLNTNSKNLNQLCNRNLYDGEKGAFRCLAENKADVAFIDLKTIQNYTGKYKIYGNYSLEIENFLSKVSLTNHFFDLILSRHSIVTFTSNLSKIKPKFLINLKKKNYLSIYIYIYLFKAAFFDKERKY